jgi:hypothetical protein
LRELASKALATARIGVRRAAQGIGTMTTLKGLQFYAAAAQVIPVLLIVVGFQIRGWANQGWLRWLALGEFILVSSAEYNALAVLETEKTSWADPTLIYTAIFVMMGTIGASLFPWFYGYNPSPPTPTSPRDPKGGRGKRRRRSSEDEARRLRHGQPPICPSA